MTFSPTGRQRSRDSRASTTRPHSALAEGNYFADGRFKHPVDLIRASDRWSRAVAIVNEALAVAA